MSWCEYTGNECDSYWTRHDDSTMPKASTAPPADAKEWACQQCCDDLLYCCCNTHQPKARRGIDLGLETK